MLYLSNLDRYVYYPGTGNPDNLVFKFSDTGTATLNTPGEIITSGNYQEINGIKKFNNTIQSTGDIAFDYQLSQNRLLIREDGDGKVSIDGVNVDNNAYDQIRLGGTELLFNAVPVWTAVNRPELSSNAIQVSDWDDAINNGWYRAQAAANAPTSLEWYIGMVTVHDASWIQQEVQMFTLAEGLAFKYRRNKMNGVWSAWVRDSVVIVSATDPGGADGTVWIQP